MFVKRNESRVDIPEVAKYFPVIFTKWLPDDGRGGRKVISADKCCLMEEVMFFRSF
jgi:hypothetical protein